MLVKGLLDFLEVVGLSDLARWMSKLVKGLLVLLALFAISDLALFAIAVRVYFHYKQVEVDWSRSKDAADVVRSYAEAVAIIGGAIWAFFKFRKGRTYQETLGLKISAKCLSISQCTYLLITAQIKNIGASIVQVRDKGSGVSLWMYQPPSNTSDVLTVEKKAVAAFPLFEEEVARSESAEISDDKVLFYLEPNESIDFERLVSLPADIPVAIRVTLSAASTGGYTWEATTIVRKTDVGGENADVSNGRNNQT